MKLMRLFLILALIQGQFTLGAKPVHRRSGSPVSHRKNKKCLPKRKRAPKKNIKKRRRPIRKKRKQVKRRMVAAVTVAAVAKPVPCRIVPKEIPHPQQVPVAVGPSWVPTPVVPRGVDEYTSLPGLSKDPKRGDYLKFACNQMNVWRPACAPEGAVNEAMNAIDYNLIKLPFSWWFGFPCPLQKLAMHKMHGDSGVISILGVPCVVADQDKYDQLPQCAKIVDAYEQAAHIKQWHDIKSLTTSIATALCVAAIQSRVSSKVVVPLVGEKHTWTIKVLNLLLGSAISIPTDGLFSHLFGNRSTGQQQKEVSTIAAQEIVKLPQGQEIIDCYNDWAMQKGTRL